MYNDYKKNDYITTCAIPFIITMLFFNSFIINTPQPNVPSNILADNLCFNRSNCDLKLALKRCSPSDGWSIHGLWLDYANGSYPSYCKKSKMTFEMPSNRLFKEMNNYWYACPSDVQKKNQSSREANIDFWKHELNKHGSCIKYYIFPTLSSEQYYNGTLQIFKGLAPVSTYLCQNGTNCYISLKS